jgi:hypothetical protein
LAAPAELAQDAPNVSFVIAHSALVFDQLAYPARGSDDLGRGLVILGLRPGE